MKQYTIRPVKSSGRERLDLCLDGREVATFYPGQEGSRLYEAFLSSAKEAGDIVFVTDGAGGRYRIT